MNSRPWYKIIRKDPFNEKKETIAYLKYIKDTSRFNSKNTSLPLFKIKKIMVPKHLDKIVLNKKGKIIASFQEGNYLKEYLNKYEKAERIVQKEKLPSLKPEFATQLTLFPIYSEE
jgi:hypothetical protein